MGDEIRGIGRDVGADFTNKNSKSMI